MSFPYRSMLAVLTVAVFGLQPAGINAAELRTTLCDRPVCRTVAISPVPAPETLTTDAVFEDYGGEYYGGGGCSDGCQACRSPNCGAWVDFDFLLGWRHAIRTPPLVATSPNGTADADAGVLPGATVVYPSEPIGEEARPGGRISIGRWLDACRSWGIEGRYFMLSDQSTTFSLDSTGDPILARPFFDVAGDAQAARLLAFPGILEPGRIDITTESEFLGGDALLRRGLCRWDGGYLDFLVGYQFAKLDEGLLISDSSTDVDPGNLILDGTVLAINDLFLTRNEYHAATLGAAMKMQRNCWQWEVMGKIGLGNMKESVAIGGTTTTTVPGAAPVTNQFGLLAQGTNLGTFTQDKFSVSPELVVKAVYSVNQCVDVSCGYTLLYFTSAAQPGQQIDPALLVPTDRFEIRESEFWMHAFQCGVSMRF